MSEIYIPVQASFPSCKYNPYIMCELTTGRKCHVCGWNPTVSKDRMKEIYKVKPKTVDSRPKFQYASMRRNG